MATTSYVSGSYVEVSGINSPGITLPSGVAAGDVVIIATNVYNASNNAITVTGPTGWTQQTAFSGTTGFASRLWTKVATTADLTGPQAQYTVAAAGTNYHEIRIAAFRAPAPTLNFSASFSTAVVPSIAAKAGDGLFLFAALASTAGSTTTYYATPTGYTVSSSGGVTSTPYAVTGSFYRIVTADGTTGGEALSYTGQATVLSIRGGSAPNAPTLTAPANGATLDRNAVLTHTWTHSDPDGDPQAGYDLRYRIAGTSSDWTVITAPTAGATASYAAPASRYAGAIEWQVRTYDGVVGAGPWSTSRTFSAADPGTPVASQLASQLDPLALLTYNSIIANRGNLPTYATTDLPADGPVGRLVYDSTTNQVKVKTDAATATYAGVGGQPQKAQGTFVGDGTSPRAIAVGFQPDLVMISSSAASGNAGYAWLHRSEAQTYTQSGRLASSSTAQFSTEYLSTTGFVVGNLNVSGGTYAWTAFKFL